VVAERWRYLAVSRILELSTKCPPGQAFQVAAESRAMLAGRCIDLGVGYPIEPRRTSRVGSDWQTVTPLQSRQGGHVNKILTRA